MRKVFGSYRVAIETVVIVAALIAIGIRAGGTGSRRRCQWKPAAPTGSGETVDSGR
jgi:hypothetical protein